MGNMMEDRNKRTEWFMKDRFGMFIHWGLYAIPARGEWVKSIEKIGDEEYQKYFDDYQAFLLFFPITCPYSINILFIINETYNQKNIIRTNIRS